MEPESASIIPDFEFLTISFPVMFKYLVPVATIPLPLPVISLLIIFT